MTIAATLLLSPISALCAGARHVLFYSIFKVGTLAITPLFLLKGELIDPGLDLIEHGLEERPA